MARTARGTFNQSFTGTNGVGTATQAFKLTVVQRKRHGDDDEREDDDRRNPDKDIHDRAHHDRELDFRAEAVFAECRS